MGRDGKQNDSTGIGGNGVISNVSIIYPSTVLVTAWAVRIELFTAQVLCRASCRVLEYSLTAEVAINYRVAQNKRTVLLIFISQL